MKSVVRSIQSIVICLYLISTVQSIMFYLPANVKKCLKEEIHKDVLVKGEYELSAVAGHETRLDVTDSRGHILYKKENAAKGKFAFTTDEYDVFQICFETKIVARKYFSYSIDFTMIAVGNFMGLYICNY
jgi:hypothetical protein